jgi:acyl-CoA thioesterase-1
MIKNLLIFFCIFTCSLQASIKIGVIGDSISIESLFKDPIYHRIAEKNLREQGFDVVIINDQYTSVGGSKTDTGLARLHYLMEKHKIDILVLTLGLNDVYLGVPRYVAYNNLKSIIQTAINGKIKVILGSVDVHFNAHFVDIYHVLENEFPITVFPFYFSLITDPVYTGQDKIHPNGEGHKIVASILENKIKLILKN